MEIVLLRALILNHVLGKCLKILSKWIGYNFYLYFFANKIVSS